MPGEVPPPLFVPGAAAQRVVGAPWDALEAQLREHGPTIVLPIAGAPTIVSADPEVLRHVLLVRADNFNKDMRTMTAFRGLLGDGLLTSDGALWRRERATLAPAFRPEALIRVAEVSWRAALRASDALDEHARRGEAVDVGAMFRRFALQVIAEAALSMPAEQCDEALARVFVPLVAEANRRVWLPQRAELPIPARFAYERCLGELEGLLRAKIDERREARAREPDAPARDMLDLLLAAADPWTDAAARLVSDELKTMLFAGHETTGLTLTWTLHALTRNAGCLQRLREAVDDEFAGEVMPGLAALRRLDYAGACLREALRIFNIVPVVHRTAIADDRFGELAVPAGCRVILHLQAIHRDPRWWPEPDVFRPERFLSANATDDMWRWLPFVHGPRGCVGQHFALIEAKIVLALLVRRFEFSPEPGNSDERHRTIVPVGPAAPMLMRARRRM